MTKVPFVDLKAQYLTIKDKIDQSVSNVIEKTAFIGGKYVEEFEQAFAKMYNVKHCISCANGTDSLYIMMKMLGIGQGDEVITVANSWISSSETISQTGAKPVFVDIDPVYYSINETLIEKAITKNTKAIIPVHLQGQMCEIEAIKAIAQKYNLFLLEDCAQSHFSSYKGGLAGTFGLAASFSFYPGKNLGAYGDAGCIITNDDDLALKFRMYARHGALKKHQHQIEGVNSRLDGIQAAILSAKLPYILEWTAKRRKNAQLYNQYLSGIEGIVLPEERPETIHTYHLYVIRTSNREALINLLKENGVETSIHYPVAIPNMKAYSYLGHTPQEFPVASRYQDEILSLPMYPELTEEQIEHVATVIKAFVK